MNRNMKIIEQVMQDEHPIIAEMNIRQAWILIAYAQLGYRHPGVNPDMKARVREAVKPFEDAIVSRHPEARKVLELGWRT